MSAQPSSSSQSQKAKVFVCDQHASNISRNLQALYKEHLLVDIALTSKTDNFKVHAHRAVLSAASGHFRTMLCSALKEARTDVIQLEIDGATLKLVIDFMYSGTIELRCDNVGRILEAADVFKLSTLKAECSKFIEESIDLTNWLSMASLAKEQHSAKLRERAFAFAIEHFEEVRQKDDFLQLTEDNLSEIISSDELCVDSEESVFHSLVSWVEYDKQNREKCITNLLTHVRFSFLKSEFIMENNNFICKTVESSEVIFSWLESSMSGTKLTKQHSERKKANGTQIETLGFVSGLGSSKFKFQTLDPESNTWSSEDLLHIPISGSYYRGLVIDKKLIMASYSDRITHFGQLDLQTNEWTVLPPMQQPYCKDCGIAELNGDLFIVGGNSSQIWLRSMEKYDFHTGKWQELAPMHLSHQSVKVTVLDGLLYAVGDNGHPIECYNPASNKWTQISHKTERSTMFGIAGVGGYLYAVGGAYNGRLSKTFERYNPSTETWTVISPGFGIALHSLRCVSYNNRLIIWTGANSEGKVRSYVDEYNPVKNEWNTLTSLLKCDSNYSYLCLFTFTK